MNTTIFSPADRHTLEELSILIWQPACLPENSCCAAQNRENCHAPAAARSLFLILRNTLRFSLFPPVHSHLLPFILSAFWTSTGFFSSEYLFWAHYSAALESVTMACNVNSNTDSFNRRKILSSSAHLNCLRQGSWLEHSKKNLNQN